MTDSPQVKHDRAARRFELEVDGRRVSRISYRDDGPTITILSTVTEPAYRGRGYAAVVTRAALDELRPIGKPLVVLCWYVRDFIADHPEYADLVAA